MRLVALPLSGLLVAVPALAQAARSLPWEGLPPAFWQGLVEDLPEPTAPAAGRARPPARWVRVTADGTLRVVDARGVVRLRSGLPGRPLRVWRDGGVPVAAPWERIPFPTMAEHPLFSGAFWSGADPRAGLDGLLWIQDDGERVLSLVHPATSKVAFLPLPGPPGLVLAFHREGLVAVEEEAADPVAGSRRRRWILPWIGLAPVLARLAPPAEAPRSGTALQPFPKE